jgi:hypothetical protein
MVEDSSKDPFMIKQEEALLLLQRAGLLASNASLDEAREADRNRAVAIVTALDGSEIAIELAGAYIEATNCNLSDFLMDYQKKRMELGRRGSLFTDYREAVAVIIILSLEVIEKLNTEAAVLLRFCAFLAPDAIPEEILTVAPDRGHPLGPLATDTFMLNEAITLLQRYALLQRNVEIGTISLHLCWLLGTSVQKTGGKEWKKIGNVSTRVNGQFSISSCLILLASQMGRETLSSLKSLFFERIS